MWLIGMMGSGKTTVGRAAARSLDVAFHDTDDLVTELVGTSIPEIWERFGEEGFRRWEREAVASVPMGGVVAAAGGGAVLDESSRAMIALSPPVVWLKASPEALAARLGSGGGRPLLEGTPHVAERLRAILVEREPAYRGLATDQVETTGRSLDQVVAEVIGLWTD